MKLAEAVLGSELGTPIEALSRLLISKRNTARYRGELSEQQYAQAMRAESTVSKHHPRNQQERILGRFEERWRQVQVALLQIAGPMSEVTDAAFDRTAHDYDTEFTDTLIGPMATASRLGLSQARACRRARTCWRSVAAQARMRSTFNNWVAACLQPTPL